MGNEINAIKKDPQTVEVSIALGFPDVYEVGMSHLGLKILYQILNSQDWIAAERVFCPWVDLEVELRDRKRPLTTLESNRSVSSFDVVGFSLQHELCATNVLTMLDLAGIPFLAEERNSAFPLIIGGGPAAFNSEPVLGLFDAILIGDGEVATLEICKTIREVKRRSVTSKRDILIQLSKIQGVYVPAFFDVQYEADGKIGRIESNLPGYERVEKAIVPDIEQCPFPAAQVVPFAELVHDRLSIEISRGCTRGCRFCQAGMIYRPVRERRPESIIEHAHQGLCHTGFDELSLLSLSSGDYSCIGPLLKELMDRHSKDRVAVSFPSLRVDSLDPQWFDEIKRVRKTGFTLAPEAGNDRLRRIVNKALTDNDILETSRAVYGAGWNLIKLYFMVGLPGEDDKDLEDLIQLALKVSRLAKNRGRGANLNVSLATFVPKSHTPFMWFPQIPLEESVRRIGHIQEALDRHRWIRVKWNQPEMSWLEGVFARGDRRLLEVVATAWKLGARFDAWGEQFKKDLWDQAFERSGLDPGFYLYRSRSFDEILPWDHLKSGVKKGYLKQEWERAMAQRHTPDCRDQCLECGVCDHTLVDPVIQRDWGPDLKTIYQNSERTESDEKTLRLTFSKTGVARCLGHLELMRAFIRGLKRAGLNLVYSQGFHPLPKVSFASALPVGVESIEESVDFQIRDSLSPSDVKQRIGPQLPEGIRIINVENISRRAKTARIKETHFTITINGLVLDLSNLEGFLASDAFPIVKSGKKGKKNVDARQVVKSMALDNQGMIKLVMKHINGPQLKPIEIVMAVFGLTQSEAESLRVLKTRQVIE